LKTLVNGVDRQGWWLFPGLSIFIVGMLTGVLVLGVTTVTSKPVLPIEFRLEEPELSNLPVEFSNIRSCSCWHGPRDEAQRKYKFRVVNHSHEVINIGGGVNSQIRLIVAYPKWRKPMITMPASGPIIAETQLGSPRDELTPITERIVAVKPNLIDGANQFFGVPSDYRVWGLPATPNKVAEIFEPGQMTATSSAYSMYRSKSGTASYPTEVEQTELLPGEEYASRRLGHGTWSFYIPIPHHFAERFESDTEQEFEPILRRQEFEKYVIFVGVAAMEVFPGGRVRLLGFAPAPSENALVNPRTL
jgi:hypothetical protein